MGKGEEMGGFMARMLKDSTGTKGRPGGMEGALRLGDSIVIKKTAIKEGAKTSVAPGQPFGGTYMEELSVGKPFNYGTGNTSKVINYHSEGNKVVIETETSIYELSKV